MNEKKSALHLLKICPNALSIESYIHSILGTNQLVIISDNDTKQYIEFCKNVYVVPENNPIILNDDNVNISNQNSARFVDMLNSFVPSCVRSNLPHREKNILSLGCSFRREDSNGAPLINCPDVEYLFSNTTKSILEWSSDWAPLWSRLASRIGELLIRRLLARPIFCPVENGCFIQVAGIPIAELMRQQSVKRSIQDKLITNPYASRKKDKNFNLSNTFKKTNPLNVVGSTSIPRFGIFYRSNYTEHAGLPRNHIFFRKDVTGNTVIAHAFQLDIDIVNNNKYPVYHKLRNIFEDIIISYKACNIFDALTKHCPLPATGQTENVQQYDSSMEQESLSTNFPTQSTLSLSGFNSQSLTSPLPDISPFIVRAEPLINLVKSKKIKRGCRGGVNKNRCVQNKTTKITPSKSRESFSSKTTRKQIITVGDRLFKKVLYNLKRVPIDDGFQSQEEDEEYITCKRSLSEESEIMSLQESKKAKINPEPSNFVCDSYDSNLAFPYSFSSSDGSNITIADVQATKIDNITVSTCRDIGLQKHLKDRVFLTTGSLSSGEAKSGTQLEPKVNNRKRKISNDDLSQLDQVSWSSPATNVSSFIKSICRRVFTLKNVWGCRLNLNIFLKNVDVYIKLGRAETITINELVKGMKLNDIPWLKHVSKNETSHDLYGTIFEDDNDPEVDTQRDDEIQYLPESPQYIFNVFIYWIFADFINPLIAASFYTTEAEGRSNEVTFFRKPIWARVMERGEEQMKNHFMELPFYEEELLDQNVGQKRTHSHPPTQEKDQPLLRTHSNNDTKSNALKKARPTETLPTIRFLPKKNCVRPITNFRVKSGQSSNSSSTTALYNCMHILKHIYNRNPVLIGFGAFGFDEIYIKIRRYKELLNQHTLSLPSDTSGQQYYIATLDLEKCYDNVDSKQLYNLVVGLINDSNNSDDYVLHRYTVSHYITSSERVVSKTLRLVGDGMITFEEAANKIAEKYRSSIITDNVLYSTINKGVVLEIISDYLFNHVVKMPFTDFNKKNGNFYTQVKGIPQGSVLSPHLCNLYYGNAEREIFGSEEEVDKLGLKDKSVIVRLMDDYIMISKSKEAVLHFLQKSHQKFKMFGGTINHSKTRVNFDAEIECDGQRIKLNVIPMDNLTWCGLSINTKTLEFKPCFNRILAPNINLVSSMTIERCSNVGVTLRRFIKSFVRTKCHAIVLDGSINSYPSVLESVYTMFLVAAMRTACYIRKIGYTDNRFDFVCKCIDEAVKFGAHLIHTRTRNKVHKNLTILEESNVDEINDSKEDKDLKLFSKCVVPSSYSNYGHCELTQLQACRIGFKAFLTCMEHNAAFFSKIIEHLKFKLTASEKDLSDDIIAIDDDIITKITMKIRHN